MRKIWLITVNTLAEIRHQRTVWLALLVAVLVGLSSAVPLVMLDRARAAGHAAAAERLGRLVVDGMIGAWYMAAYLLAGFQGSSALSSELRSKTIATVLARPIERWQYLVGRLLGVEIFALSFFALGMVLTAAVACYFTVPIASLFQPEMARHLVAITFAANVSLALGVIWPQQLAAAAALALPLLPGLTAALAGIGNEFLETLATVTFYVCPAVMPDHLISSPGSELVHPRYDLFVLILSENMLYAMTATALACWWFSRREIRLDG